MNKPIIKMMDELGYDVELTSGKSKEIGRRVMSGEIFISLELGLIG